MCIFRRLLFIFISVTAVLMVCLEMEETLKSSITELSHFSNTLPTIHIQRIFNLDKYFFLKQSQSFTVIFNFTKKKKIAKNILPAFSFTHTLYIYILWQVKGFFISLMGRTLLVCTAVYVYIFKPVNIFFDILMSAGYSTSMSINFHFGVEGVERPHVISWSRSRCLVRTIKTQGFLHRSFIKRRER